MKSMLLGKKGFIISLLLVTSLLALGTSVYVRVQNDQSPWHGSNGWGICGGYGTTYLKEIPTDIYPAVYNFFNIPLNRIGAITAYAQATSVDPKKESIVPHKCSSPPNNIEGTDSTISGIVTTPLIYKAEMAKTLANARKRYSGVIPPGATKAIQILVSENLPWPNYSGHDPYILNLQMDGNYLLTQIHDLVLGYYPKSGWKVVFEYSKSDAPYQGYPPTGS